MIEIKPYPGIAMECPNCGSREVVIGRAIFSGIHVMGEAECKNCQEHFWQDYPVGHAIDQPMSIKPQTMELYPGPIHEGFPWLREDFERILSNPIDSEVRISKKVYKEHPRVVILNTLDYLYGHVLLKLFNAQFYLDNYPELGLVIIVPKMMEWLVPEGVAEVWTVHISLKKSMNWLRPLDEFVQMELSRFSEVHISKAYSHPDFQQLDIGRFTGIDPFQPETFLHKERKVCFILREDRLWFRGEKMKFIHRLSRKFPQLPLLRSWCVRSQMKSVLQVMEQIRNELPDTKFVIAGLGKSGQIPSYVEDLRTDKMDLQTERTWLRAYAESHVVCGIHGSNMLLPSAMAASSVEILPEDRFGNMIQDIVVRYYDRRQLFMHRFTDEFARPSTVANHILSILIDYPEFERTMCKQLPKEVYS
ncbi:MAG: hypothetical protein AAF824_02730 [Bacteroidota bacterium]